MPTPSKPFAVLQGEKKSHRTKAELNQRKQAEAAMLTGTKIKMSAEVKGDDIARSEFKRIIKLLNNIDKNDAIYEQVINRYCLLISECENFKKRKDMFFTDLQELENDREKFIDLEQINSYYKLKNDIQKNIISLDKQLQSKRKMLLDIEKENIMTIASALRNIPKKVETKSNKLVEILSDSG